jgi:hypothetical protein
MRSILVFVALVALVHDASSKATNGSVRGSITLSAGGKAKSDKKGVVVYL